MGIRRRNFDSTAIALLLLTLPGLFGCTPQYFWPQKDIAAREVNSSDLRNKILIASRQSAFKEAVVKRIENHYRGKDVYVKIIGLGQLDRRSDSTFSAVVLVNTCLAWDMDRNVKRYLKAHPRRSGLVIVTTSGDGRWAPKQPDAFDAIACASADSRVDEVTTSVLSSLEKHLEAD